MMKGQEEDKILELRSLLLEEDRQRTSELHQKLSELDALLREQDKLSGHISPILDERMAQLKRDFPTEYGDVITTAIKTQIRESKDEVIDALYPIMGRLIRKFIGSEMEKLKENMIGSPFSKMKTQLKSIFRGKKASDLMARNAFQYNIENIYLIAQDSGLLLASYSKEDHIDKDVLAGMLTAIISFVEDAFQQGNRDLETIDYGDYKIVLQDFNAFYAAVVVSGVITVIERSEINEQLRSLLEAHIPSAKEFAEEGESEEISKKLEEYYSTENEKGN